MTLHCHNAVAQKNSIACIDTAVGDFNGACGRRKSGSEEQDGSTLGEAFRNARLPVPCGPTPLWGSGGIPSEWTDVCGLVMSQNSQAERLIREHGAFEIAREELGLSSKDQISHCETWIHLSHVNTPTVEREREQRERRLDHSRRGGRKRKIHTSQS